MSKIDKKNPASDSLVLKRMQMLCSRQERCTSDIRKRIAGFNLSEEETDNIIDTLSKDNFINDERYAFSFVHDKFSFNKWGKIKIGYGLKLKGISKAYISKALDSIDSSDYRLMLKSELMKKFKKSGSSDKLALKSKLLRFGQYRGFETELIFDIINEILSAKGK